MELLRQKQEEIMSRNFVPKLGNYIQQQAIIEKSEEEDEANRYKKKNNSKKLKKYKKKLAHPQAVLLTATYLRSF